MIIPRVVGELEVVVEAEGTRRRAASSVEKKATCLGNAPVEVEAVAEEVDVGSAGKMDILPGIVLTAKEEAVVVGPVISVARRGTFRGTVLRPSQTNVSSARKKGTRLVIVIFRMFAGSARKKVTWLETASFLTLA